MRVLFSLVVLSLLVACGDGCGAGGKLRETKAQVQVASELQLGRPFVGDQAEASFPVTATGDGAIRVLNVSSTYPGLSIEWRQITLARGATLDVRVSWTPVEPGLLDTTIEVEVDLEEARHHTVRVTGEAREVPSCDDGNACTDDLFDRQREECTYSHHQRACDDGNACTENDQCQNGICKGAGRSCNDDNACTQDFCDPTSGCVFLPDERTCDDGDPCTADLCDPDSGCSQQPTTGPSCGEVSCATAHVCVAGVCKELDISASSDGFPCSDGNACTEGDQCLGGQCRSGTPRPNTGPEIVATLDTYGGEGAFVTTDGYRYLFVDRRDQSNPALRNLNDPKSMLVALHDGTALVPQGSTEQSATAPPIVIVPGYFAVPNDSRVDIIDANDPAKPFLFRSSFPGDPNTHKVLKLVRLEHGFVALVRGPKATGEMKDRIYFWDHPGSIGAGISGPYPFVRWFDEVYDIDGDGSTVVVSSSEGVIWFRIGPTATLGPETILRPPPVNGTRVSIQGDNVTMLLKDELELVRPSTGKSLAKLYAPGGSDIELIGDTLYLSAQEGIYANTMSQLVSGKVSTVPIDAEPSATLERAPDHLLLNGEIALPLKLSGGTTTTPPTATRITGVGHGSATVSTDGPGSKVRIAGRMMQGEVDLESKAFSHWSLLPHAPTRQDGYLLQGSTRTVPIAPRISVSDGPLGVCDGPTWSRFDGAGVVNQFRVCGLLEANVAVTPDALWASTINYRPGMQASPMDTWAVYRWSLNPFQSSFNQLQADPVGWRSVGVRTADDQTQVAWLSREKRTSDADPIRHMLGLYWVMPGGSFPAPLWQAAFEETESSLITDMSQVSVDSSGALTILDGTVRLHPLRGQSFPPAVVPNGSLPSLVLPDPKQVPGRVAWMANGRAWISWERASAGPGPVNQLSYLRYDAGTSTLENLGDVSLPAPLSSVYGGSDLAVATTNTAVLLVAPACQ